MVSSTSQGVTIQLVIPKSDFLFDDNRGSTGATEQLGLTAQISEVENPVISFPGCNFTTEFGMPRLPMQSTFIGVPPDATFQVRIVEKDFSTHKVETITSIAGSQKDSYYPQRLAEIGNIGWIRENRILPIQLNPVQYNPVRREVRL